MIAYLRERARPGIFIPAAALIALAGHIGDPIAVTRFAMSSALVLLLIAQFRLWDDVADIETDRLEHPHRVLSRSAHLDRFVVFGLLLATANLWLSAWIAGAAGMVILILLDAAMATWYALRPRHRTALGDLVVLAKYPTFVLIVAGSSVLPEAHLPAALGVYAGACVFEIWHDASSPLRRRVNA